MDPILSNYIDKLLQEAITFSPRINDKWIEPSHVLKNNDVVRVYHGFYDSHNAYEFCKYGASGKELADRVYSYESNNNPYGLFVTAVFKTAKRFARGAGGPAIIIEFNARVSDLEAPVWPGGSFTVQGQMAQYWSGNSLKDKMANREKERLNVRASVQNSTRKDVEFAKKSDKPELSVSLFLSGEYQALFIGDLDPNMIRAVWVYEGTKSPEYDTFTRMSRKDFLKKYIKLGEKQKGMYGYKEDKTDKLYKPTEDWKGIQDFIVRFCKQKDWKESDIIPIVNKELEDKAGKERMLQTFKHTLWPKQFKQAIEDLDLDKNYYIPENNIQVPPIVSAVKNPKLSYIFDKKVKLDDTQSINLSKKIHEMNIKLRNSNIPPIVLNKDKSGYTIIDWKEPIFDGYEFIGNLKEDVSGNTVRLSPYATVKSLPYTLINGSAMCDVCKLNRNRHSIFLLRKIDSGIFTKVGSGCLKKFLPKRTIDSLILYVHILGKLNNILKEIKNPIPTIHV